MRKIAIACILSVGFILTACSSKQPQIILETEQFDFGDVVNGDVITRDLIVQNEGDAPLIVSEVTTSCGCTQAVLEPTTILPGESALLHIEFDSGAHGPDLNSNVTRMIFITSNDPQQSEAIVEFVANIVGKDES